MALDTLKRSARKLLHMLNIGVVKFDVLERLIEAARQSAERTDHFEDAKFLSRLSAERLPKVLQVIGRSNSQIRQDVFVLSQLDFKRNGFFVEFGASNGISASNTYLLEKEYGWTGILAEPARCWHEDLHRNRKSAIEPKCVWKESNAQILFNEAINPSLSSVDSLEYADWAQGIREISEKKYPVETISLVDLLKKHRAPSVIDYLSVDVEGSEFEVLSAFDFNGYQFRVITCEHNNTAMRESIHALLTSHDYVRKHDDLTKFEDWYVLEPPPESRPCAA
jgi:FkbM family methyltransferase